MAERAAPSIRIPPSEPPAGPGTIRCPLKRSEIAFARCLEWQKESAARGDACTCDVYRADPRAAGASLVIAPEQLCGRVIDEDLDAQLEAHAADLELTDRQREVLAYIRGYVADVGIVPTAVHLAKKRELGITSWTNADRFLELLEAKGYLVRDERDHLRLREDVDKPVEQPLDEREEPPMATHKTESGLCAACGEKSPAGTRMRDGLCKPCRDKKAANDRAKLIGERAQVAKESKTLDDVASRHVSPGVAARVPKQPLLPSVAEARIAELELQLEAKDRQIAQRDAVIRRLRWLVEGVRQGFAKLDELTAAANNVDASPVAPDAEVAS
jgi:hypothetical protein